MALYPVIPAFKSFSADLSFDTAVSTSVSGREQASGQGGAPVQISAKYNKLTYTEAQRVRAFLSAHGGQLSTFDLYLPLVCDASGDYSGAALRASASVAQGHSVAINGAEPHKTLTHAGQWIQFAGHDKTYLLTSDLTTDGAGHAVADFQPSLYEPVALNEQVFISNIHFKVRADSDFHKFTIQPGQQYTFSVSFVESIR